MNGPIRENQDTTVRPARTSTWVSVCGLLAVGAIQVGYFLAFTRDPVLWRDEAATVQLAADAWAPMWAVFLDDWKTYSHSLALTVWLKVFGTGESAARSFSLVACLLATWLLYRGLARDAHDRATGLLGAALFGLAPLLLHFLVGNAAAYGFALFTCVWAWERLLHLEQNRSPAAWAWFAVAAFSMMNAQPVNFAFAAALALVWMRRVWPGRSASAGAWIRLLSAPALMGLTALPTLVQAIRFAGAETGCGRIPASEISIGYFARIGWSALQHFCVVPGHLLNFVTDDNPGRFAREGWHTLPIFLYPLLLAVAVLSLVWIVRIVRTHPARTADALLLVLVPVLILGLGGLGNDRLVISFKNYSAFPVGLALLMLLPFGRARGVLAGLVVLLALRSVAALPWFIESRPGRAGDGREAAAYVAAHEQPGDLIVLANTTLSPAFSYYYHGRNDQLHHPYGHPIRYYNIVRMYRDQGDPQLLADNLARLEQAARAGRRVWFLTGGTPEPLPPHRWYSTDDLPHLQAVLARDFERVENVRFATTWEPFGVSLWTPRAAPAVASP